MKIVGFGTFAVAKRAATKGRNPKTGEPIKIAASKMPKFKAGKGLKDAVKYDHASLGFPNLMRMPRAGSVRGFPHAGRAGSPGALEPGGAPKYTLPEYLSRGAVSSAGRAPRLHRGCREFEPLTAHQTALDLDWGVT